MLPHMASTWPACYACCDVSGAQRLWSYFEVPAPSLLRVMAGTSKALEFPSDVVFQRVTDSREVSTYTCSSKRVTRGMTSGITAGYCASALVCHCATDRAHSQVVMAQPAV